MPDKNLSVSCELLTQLQARAKVEGITVDELAEEALRRPKRSSISRRRRVG
jgi:hypothetical protein